MARPIVLSKNSMTSASASRDSLYLTHDCKVVRGTEIFLAISLCD